MLTPGNVEARIESIRDHLSRDNYEIAQRNEVVLYQDVLLAIAARGDDESLKITAADIAGIFLICQAALRVRDLLARDGRPWRRGFAGGGPG